MSEPFFFASLQGLSLGEIIELTKAEAAADAPRDRRVTALATLDRAGPRDIAFLDSPKFRKQLAATRAGLCLVTARDAALVPSGTIALTVAAPYAAFVTVARALHPEALRPSSLFEAAGIQTGASVHPQARLESGVTVDPGAVIGPRAEIGAGTVIGPAAVIGPGVRIGRDCAIGAGASVTHCLIGDRVIVHPGVRIGQDGFGFVMGARHQKVPQVGRVIIQNDVEIGANSTIDRGAIKDTVIGEGTKIDNLVQIGHNVTIGRHCVVIAQTGIAGSSTLEDFVVLGARVGIGNNYTIGEGAQLAALTVVGTDIPPGGRWGGMPAKPVQLWLREMKLIERMTKEKFGSGVPEPPAAADE